MFCEVFEIHVDMAFCYRQNKFNVEDLTKYLHPTRLTTAHKLVLKFLLFSIATQKKKETLFILNNAIYIRYSTSTANL